MSEASQIVYEMESCKSYLQYAERELEKNQGRVKKLTEELEQAKAETPRLASDVESKRLKLQAALQRYARAGVNWCKIEAVEPKSEASHVE